MVEVAHDYQVQVQRYITDELKLINSYDTWHGMLVRKVIYSRSWVEGKNSTFEPLLTLHTKDSNLLTMPVLTKMNCFRCSKC